MHDSVLLAGVYCTIPLLAWVSPRPQRREIIVLLYYYDIQLRLPGCQDNKRHNPIGEESTPKRPHFVG